MPQFALDVDYHAILPEMLLAGTILVVLTMDLFLRPERKWWAMPVSFVGVAAALGATLSLMGATPRQTLGAYVIDDFAILFKTFFLSVALVILMISLRYLRDGRYFQGEYYFLLLASFLGMLTISSSRDLLMLFISLELVSAPAFIIAGLRKRDPRSNEGAMKFFLIGILSAAVMLYGMSLVYGATGTLTLEGIAERFGEANRALALAGVLFVIAGFGFKISSVPFHFWAPDTYEGSPVPVAAFLSVASKAAGFAGLLQLMFLGFAPTAGDWTPIFAVLAILTMSIGNLIALQQTQVVRLLAYSSIAQAGYMMVPFALVGGGALVEEKAFSAAVLYILIYGVMNLGAFSVVVGMARESPGALVTDFAGMGRRNPMMAVSMLVFLLSLAGLPPLAGFWAKFFLFDAAITGEQPWLAVAIVVNSVISLYYYITIARQMFFVEAAEERPFRPPVLVTGVVAVAAAAVVGVGVFPDLFATFSTGITHP